MLVELPGQCYLVHRAGDTYTEDLSETSPDEDEACRCGYFVFYRQTCAKRCTEHARNALSTVFSMATVVRPSYRAHLLRVSVRSPLNPAPIGITPGMSRTLLVAGGSRLRWER